MEKCFVSVTKQSSGSVSSMSADGRDEVTVLSTKRLVEMCVVIVAGTTLHDGDQSCCARDRLKRGGGRQGSH
jgi:hypothetical protein